MTALELQSLLRSPAPPKLIHVLPPEVYAAARIPGSQNACVYEMAFLDQVRVFAANPSTPLVVYGAAEGWLDAVTAAKKLLGAGYSQVQVFEGGFPEWKAAGLPLEGDGNFPLPVLPDGTFELDTAQSVIRWTGRNVFSHHNGTVKLTDGEITLRAGDLVSARFTIDMGSIVNEDLTDPDLNALLIAHLKSDDFFDVANHPTAQFVAESAVKIDTCTDGTPNVRLRGTFTLRGISRPLEFPAVIGVSDDGKGITGQAQLEIDRTEYGCTYGSGKLFHFLGKHLVNDHVQLHVKICAKRQP